MRRNVMMKKQNKLKKGLAKICSLMLATTAVLQLTGVAYATEAVETVNETATEAGIVVDGVIDDWAAMRTSTLGDSDITSFEFKFAKSWDGSMLYYYFAGPAVSEWDGSYDWKYLEFIVNGTTVPAFVQDIADRWSYPGAEAVRKNTANGNNPGILVYEGALPCKGANVDIRFEGLEISNDDIPVFVPVEEVEAVYNGIVIDGKFYDWAAVMKTDAACPEEAGHNYECLSQTAAIFDGDYVYIYLRDGEDGCAAGAGIHSNGRFSIVTDTGRTLTFEVNAENGGSIAGVEGATAAYFGDQWEIAIPASQLPLYKETISFGLYQTEPFLTGIADIQGGEGTAGTFTGIEYDGHFGDWNAYPHELIHYATSGTQTNSPDGEGALYCDGNTGILYGHVVSSMDAHLGEGGGEFASAVSIFFNGEHDYNHDRTNNLYPRFVAVAQDGTINWSPQTVDLENGTYEFYIADARGEYDTNTITNVSQLAEHEKFFGKMIVEVTDTRDEMEFFVDLEQVAKFLSYYSKTTVDANDFQLIEAQFGRIGQEILSTAGTSSGPYMGIAVCIAVVAITALKKKRNKAVA